MNALKQIRLVIAAVLLAVLLAGCFDILGGGWIWSALGPDAGKATFGFNLHCDEDTNDAWGHITFHDHGVLIDSEYYDFVDQDAYWKGKAKHMAIQGDVFAGLGFDLSEGDFGCSDDFALYASYIGTYTPVPHTIGPPGIFHVAVNDGGEPGPDNDDWLEITIVSGVYAGYFNIGYLQGGNIYLPE